MLTLRKAFLILLIGSTQLFFGQGITDINGYYYQISTADGLTNDKINDIVQDKLGYIWIATDDGLSRYSGTSFKNIENNLSGKNYISDNYIQKLHLEESGNIWILTDQGLDYFDIHTETFTNFTTSNSSLSHNSPTAIANIGKDSIYVGTYGGGIDLKTESGFENVFQHGGNNSIASNLIADLLLEDKQKLWVAYFDAGLDLIDMESKSIKHYSNIYPELFTGLEIRKIELIEQYFLLIASNNGLIILDTRDDSIQHFSPNKQSNFKDFDILTLGVLGEEQLLVGTRNEGILYTDLKPLIYGKQNSWKQIKPQNKSGSLVHKSVSVFFQDQKQNLWIGTHREGLNILTKESDKALIHYPEQNFWGISESANGTQLLGTDGNGLFTRTDGKLVPISKNLGVLCTLEDQEGNRYAGTYQDGLWIYPSQGEPFVLNTSNSALLSNDIRCIYQYRETIYIGSNGGGLYTLKNGVLGHVGSLGTLDIRAINAQNQTLFIGTFGSGLITLDPDTEQVNYISDFPGNIIFDLEPSPRGMWVATRNQGLWLYDEYLQFTRADGLYSNTVQGLQLQDETLWLSTNKGIHYFSIYSPEFKGFRQLKGTVLNGFNNGSAFLSQNGKLYFGTQKGLLEINPSLRNQKAESITLLIEDITVGSEKLQVNPVDGALISNINLGGDLSLNYDQNDINLDYTALVFPFQNKPLVQYKLSPYDDTWVTSGEKGTISYRNLRPGNYTFSMRVAPNQKDFSSKTYSFDIVIGAPFYANPYAYGLYTLVFILIGVLTLRYYIKQINLKNSLQYEKKLRQQEYDINLDRAQFFTSFSHELRTPLTLIKAPVADLLEMNMSSEAKRNLTLIQSNSERLGFLIDNLLEYRKSERELKKLKLQYGPIKPFMETFYELFNVKAIEKNIDFTLAFHGDRSIYLDRDKLKIILSNLLSNAFKYTPENGKVSLKVLLTKSKMKIQVEDNGVGIAKEDLAFIFDLYYRSKNTQIKGTGIGLALCKRLVDLHFGKISVKSKAKEKTIFTMELPCAIEAFPEGEFEVVPLEDSSISTVISSEIVADNEIQQSEEIRILIIDDHEEILSYLEGLFSPMYKVYTARNGQEGIDIARQLIPDLILSDVMMPEKSGTDLLEDLKGNIETSHIPILLLTAKNNEEDRVAGIEMGAEDYIFKPFNPKYLKSKVKGVLQRHEQDLVTKSKHSSLDQTFLDLLNQNILSLCEDSAFKNSTLSYRMNMSESSLYRKVKGLTGTSLTQYAIRIRLDHSLELMQIEGYTVSEAAFQVGYKDLKHFRKLFKNKFGQTPSTYLNHINS